MSHWSHLPGDLVALIGDHLIVYRDYVRFRAVCSSWRNSLPKWPKHSYYNVPWLMLPHDHDDNYDQNLQGFYDPLNHQVYYMDQLPNATHQNYLGSSEGWIATLEDGHTVKLFNPLTNSQIQLPPIPTFPDVQGYDPTRHGDEYIIIDPLDHQLHYFSQVYLHNGYIDKIVFSFTPSNDFIVIAIFSNHERLAFTKYGDDKWTMIPTSIMNFEDCIVFNGKIYAINRYGVLVVSSVHDPTKVVNLDNVTAPELQLGDKLYLVKTDDDELFMVEKVVNYFRVLTGFKHNYTTVRFNLFKLDSSNNRWLKINNIDDYTIFLGLNTSVCISSKYCPKLKGNHIYYTDDLLECHIPGYIDGHDFGVFNIADGGFQSLLYEERPSRLLFWPRPMWVVLNPS